ncbi:hypothetical protein T05_5203 [Trichinella murrelli]|uniref:Uncharacterized protein n=1 Tax=Trichinella murrelli TaxID=144512 RepID=A0A0V0U2P0_9BILA|nr:hypothetical protein T05_5203 [Trichinella murrelli]
MKKFHSNPTNQQPHSQSSHLLRNKSASVSLGANQTHARGDVLLQNRIYLTSRCFASRPFHGRGSFPDFEQNWAQAIGTVLIIGCLLQLRVGFSCISKHLDAIRCTEMSTASGSFFSVERLVSVAVLLTTFYRIIACSLDEQNIYVSIHPLLIVYLASRSNHIVGYYDYRHHATLMKYCDISF